MKKRTKKLLNRGVTAKKGKAQGARGGAAMAEQNTLFRNVFFSITQRVLLPKADTGGQRVLSTRFSGKGDP